MRFVPNYSQAYYREFVMEYVQLAPFAALALLAARGRRMEETSFLCLWWLVPGTALVALTAVWSNCVADRYAVYCWPAGYMLVCAAIIGFRPPLLRTAAVVLLLLVVANHAVQSLGVPTRTDYLAAARLIREKSAPGDRIIVHTWFQRPILALNMRTTVSSLEYSEHLADLCGKTIAALDRKQSVWVVVVEEPSAAELMAGFERHLGEHAVSFAKTEYDGMQKVCVYHCLHSENEASPAFGVQTGSPGIATAPRGLTAEVLPPRIP